MIDGEPGIIGVGTDIEQVERFLPGPRAERLLKRLFTAREIAYCEGRARPERHYAARFAAEEAAVKALSQLVPHLTVTQVEVLRDPDTGAPGLRLLPPAAMLPATIRLHVSLSHSDAYATAVVVAERAPSPD